MEKLLRLGIFATDLIPGVAAISSVIVQSHNYLGLLF